MFTLAALKDEYRETFAGGDWSHCKEWWFTIADELHFNRGVELPDDWRYVPSPFGSENEDTNYITYCVRKSSTDTLLYFGKMLMRLAAYMDNRDLTDEE